MKCSECQTLAGKGKRELRPYGKDGAFICFSCAMKPENRSRTEKNFGKALTTAFKQAGDGGIVLFGAADNMAPIPIKKGGRS